MCFKNFRAASFSKSFWHTGLATTKEDFQLLHIRCYFANYNKSYLYSWFIYLSLYFIYLVLFKIPCLLWSLKLSRRLNETSLDGPMKPQLQNVIMDKDGIIGWLIWKQHKAPLHSYWINFELTIPDIFYLVYFVYFS